MTSVAASTETLGAAGAARAVFISRAEDQVAQCGAVHAGWHLYAAADDGATYAAAAVGRAPTSGVGPWRFFIEASDWATAPSCERPPEPVEPFPLQATASAKSVVPRVAAQCTSLAPDRIE